MSFKSEYNSSVSSQDSCVVKCENPTLILHPYAYFYFCRYGKFCYNGIHYSDYVFNTRAARTRFYNEFKKRFINPFFKSYKNHPEKSFDFDSLLGNYHFISDDGEVLPMFMMVPCGKCKVCTYSKLNDLSARCALETYASNSKPLFVTLTYDDSHLPADGCVSLDDIQKFLKSLRINMQRFFATPYLDENGKTKYHLPKISLRYLYCSEYTPNNHRPHYHLLIWNVPYIPNDLSDYQNKFFESRNNKYVEFHAQFKNPFRQDSFRPCLLSGDLRCDIARIRGFDVLKKLIWCSWKKGFIQCSPSKDPTGRYVAKYIGKGCEVPKGLKPCFVRWSTRRGLGFDAFDSEFKGLLLANPRLTEISFLDPKFGKITKIPVPKYYRALLCPALSVLSKDFRLQLEEFKRKFEILHYYKKHGCINNSVWSGLHDSWKSVLNKFILFDSLCKLSVPLLSNNDLRSFDSVVSDLHSVANHLRGCYYLQTTLQSFKNLYRFLVDYPLDDYNLCDLVAWRNINRQSRIEYAQNNPLPLSVHQFKAGKFYDDALSKSYSSCFLQS